MNISREMMEQIHGIQLEMLKEFKIVCDSLKLKYYFVHGSLLGAVVRQGFFPYDDDIDVAMTREDYNKFLQYGQSRLPKYLFVQSCETEPEFPLQFTKIRDSRTAFIQPLLKKIRVNQGIYIDVFPIDNYPKNKIKQSVLKFYDRLLTCRINANLRDRDAYSLIKKALYSFSKIIFPSWKKAVQKRASLYSKCKKSGRVVLTGAKRKDRGLSATIFSAGVEMLFEGEKVKCPVGYKDYLSIIYGDYINYDPAQKYMTAENTVEVSAEYVSTKIPYTSVDN